MWNGQHYPVDYNKKPTITYNKKPTITDIP
jgi:hypothetical protein